MINMNGSTDPFYRYQMDDVKIKVEGSGKMIKTFILNLDKISKQINRPVKYILAYIAFEIGVSYKCDDNNFYISSRQSKEQIQEHIIKFINSFILCKYCNTPETKPYVEGTKKNLLLKLICASCGNHSLIDINHKVIKTMIIDLTKPT